jgi:hypothetical protein
MGGIEVISRKTGGGVLVKNTVSRVLSLFAWLTDVGVLLVGP